MDHSKPVPESRFVGPMLDSNGVVKKHCFRFGNAESLLALQEDWAFFTPAVLYLHGMFSDAYLIDYMFDAQADVPLYFHKFQSPLFSGLQSSTGNKDWNYALWAVAKEYWPSFLDFICSVSIANREAKHIWRFGLQELTMLDPIRAERANILTTDLPLVCINAFGLYGSSGQAYFQQNIANPFIQPRLVFKGPEVQDKVFAEAYFAGKNPINAKDMFMQKNKEGLS